MTFSVIDLGSNSIRLSIYESLERAPTILYEEGHLIELGRDLTRTGQLSKRGLQLAFKALKRFYSITSTFKTTPILLATEAIRQAQNGTDAIKKFKEQFPFEIKVLSGAEEMALASQTILFCFPEASGWFADFGGGSLEIGYLEKGNLRWGTSLPIGALRLLESTTGEILTTQNAEEHILKELKKIPSFHELGISSSSSSFLYLMGGSWRNVAKLLLEKEQYPFPLIHGFSPSPQELCSFASKLALLSPKEISSYTLTHRKKSLPRASLALKCLIEDLSPSTIFYCGYGIREGYLFSCLDAETQCKHPLLTFIQNNHPFPSFAESLFNLLKPLFDTVHPLSLKVACFICKPHFPLQYPFQAEYFFLEILNLNIGGMNHKERIFFALVSYCFSKGSFPKFLQAPFQVIKLLETSEQKTAFQLGLLIRLLYDVSGGNISLLNQLILKKETTLIFEYPSDLLIKECSLSLFEEVKKSMSLSPALQ